MGWWGLAGGGARRSILASSSARQDSLPAMPRNPVTRSVHTILDCTCRESPGGRDFRHPVSSSVICEDVLQALGVDETFAPFEQPFGIGRLHPLPGVLVERAEAALQQT